MAIDNYYIAEQFSLLSKLMDIHGENSFKTKSYSIAAFTIEKLPEQLTSLKEEKIFQIKGIGDAIGKKILEIASTGQMRLLREYIDKTPQGVIEMLNIKGLGPKKIATVWKEMEIESIGELLYACNENRLLLFKGFGEKTQKNIRETIEFYSRSKGSYLYAEAESYAHEIDKKLKAAFPIERFELTGEFRRQLQIINQLEWVTTAAPLSLKALFEQNEFESSEPEDGILNFHSKANISLRFYCADSASFYNILFNTSGSKEFLEAWQSREPIGSDKIYKSEEEIFAAKELHFIPAYRRENGKILGLANQPLEEVIQFSDIKGIIHSHSNWSDGYHTIEEMALHARDQGLEYLVISDHSKSAFYANGLNEDRLKEQHLYVDSLNQKLAPFRIFKSIESDILNDGNLDYASSILSTFDLVIASVHSNLKMTEEKAMARLLKAIENPFTTILGHMTGRLLLSRPGYPLDHMKIIDACASNKVVIELNAHPRRLDMDWIWISYALDKGVMISIDPDAHSTEGYSDVKYGMLVAQKAGLTREKNLSSLSAHQMAAFLSERKKLKGI